QRALSQPRRALARQGDDTVGPAVVRVERRYQPQRVPTVRLEALRRADVELLDRLQAVGHERRAQDQRPLDAALREPDDDLVGVWADPRRSPETRLETDDALVLGDAQA